MRFYLIPLAVILVILVIEPEISGPVVPRRSTIGPVTMNATTLADSIRQNDEVASVKIRIILTSHDEEKENEIAGLESFLKAFYEQVMFSFYLPLVMRKFRPCAWITAQRFNETRRLEINFKMGDDFKYEANETKRKNDFFRWAEIDVRRQMRDITRIFVQRDYKYVSSRKERREFPWLCAKHKGAPDIIINISMSLAPHASQWYAMVSENLEFSKNRSAKGLFVFTNHFGIGPFQMLVYERLITRMMNKTRTEFDYVCNTTAENFTTAIAVDLAQLMLKKISDWLHLCNYTSYVWGTGSHCYYNNANECQQKVVKTGEVAVSNGTKKPTTVVLSSNALYRSYCLRRYVTYEKTQFCTRPECDRICKSCERWSKCDCAGGAVMWKFMRCDHYDVLVDNCPLEGEKLRSCAAECKPPVWTVLLLGIGLLLLVLFVAGIFAGYWFLWRTPKASNAPNRRPSETPQENQPAPTPAPVPASPDEKSNIAPTPGSQKAPVAGKSEENPAPV